MDTTENCTCADPKNEWPCPRCHPHAFAVWKASGSPTVPPATESGPLPTPGRIIGTTIDVDGILDRAKREVDEAQPQGRTPIVPATDVVLLGKVIAQERARHQADVAALEEERQSLRARQREAARRVRELASRPNASPKTLLEHVADAEAEMADLRSQVAELKSHELAVAHAAGAYYAADGHNDQPFPREDVVASIRKMARADQEVAELLGELDRSKEEVERLTRERDEARAFVVERGREREEAYEDLDSERAAREKAETERSAMGERLATACEEMASARRELAVLKSVHSKHVHDSAEALREAEAAHEAERRELALLRDDPMWERINDIARQVEAATACPGCDALRAQLTAVEGRAELMEKALAECCGLTELHSSGLARRVHDAAFRALAALADTPEPPKKWGVVITEYPDEGCMGPYDSREEAEAAARRNLGDDECTVVPLTDEQARVLAAEDEIEAAPLRAAVAREKLADTPEPPKAACEHPEASRMLLLGGPNSWSCSLCGYVSEPPKDPKSRDPKCPGCGGPVKSTGPRPGWMNTEQWDADKAGDWYCETCPSNGRGRTGFAYWTDEEVRAEPPKAAEPRKPSYLRDAEGQLTRLANWLNNTGAIDGAEPGSLPADNAIEMLEDLRRMLEVQRRHAAADQPDEGDLEDYAELASELREAREDIDALRAQLADAEPCPECSRLREALRGLTKTWEERCGPRANASAAVATRRCKDDVLSLLAEHPASTRPDPPSEPAPRCLGCLGTGDTHTCDDPRDEAARIVAAGDRWLDCTACDGYGLVPPATKSPDYAEPPYKTGEDEDGGAWSDFALVPTKGSGR